MSNLALYGNAAVGAYNMFQRSGYGRAAASLYSNRRKFQTGARQFSQAFKRTKRRVASTHKRAKVAERQIYKRSIRATKQSNGFLHHQKMKAVGSNPPEWSSSISKTGFDVQYVNTAPSLRTIRTGMFPKTATSDMTQENDYVVRYDISKHIQDNAQGLAFESQDCSLDIFGIKIVIDLINHDVDHAKLVKGMIFRMAQLRDDDEGGAFQGTSLNDENNVLSEMFIDQRDKCKRFDLETNLDTDEYGTKEKFYAKLNSNKYKAYQKFSTKIKPDLKGETGNANAVGADSAVGRITGSNPTSNEKTITLFWRPKKAYRMTFRMKEGSEYNVVPEQNIQFMMYCVEDTKNMQSMMTTSEMSYRTKLSVFYKDVL